MSDRIYYEFADLKADLAAMTGAMARDGFRPDIVAGIARGGLPPAIMLSHYFAAPLIVLNRTTRDAMVGQADDGGAELAGLLAQGRRVLIVDDILDSGATLAGIAADLDARCQGRDWRALARVAVLWHNVAQPLVPDYAGRTFSREDDSRWIVFPYEDWWIERGGPATPRSE